jgi:hypothetical protein
VATCTLTVVSNTDGSLTATTASAPAQTITTLSLTEISNVLAGWIKQALNTGLS